MKQFGKSAPRHNASLAKYYVNKLSLLRQARRLIEEYLDRKGKAVFNGTYSNVFHNKTSFPGGAGIEFENDKNLGLSRLGAEYGFEMSKGWEGGISARWDDKWGHYNSWFIEFTFSKTFS